MASVGEVKRPQSHQFSLAKGAVPVSTGSISRCFLLSERSGFWLLMLHKIGGGKNPIARISLNILVNAHMGNSCLRALSMCWATWALGQEVLQVATPMPRMCQDMC